MPRRGSPKADRCVRKRDPPVVLRKIANACRGGWTSPNANHPSPLSVNPPSNRLLLPSHWGGGVGWRSELPNVLRVARFEGCAG